MSLELNIAIIGAATATGKALLAQLEKSDLSIASIVYLATEDDPTDPLTWNNKGLKVKSLADADFANTPLVFACELDDTKLAAVDRAIDYQCYVIELGSNIYQSETIFAETEADISADKHHYCSASGLAVVLKSIIKPVANVYGLNECSVSLLRSVSNKGESAVKELASQTAALLNAHPIKKKHFLSQIAFNAIPDDAMVNANGFSETEQSLRNELLVGLPFDDAYLTVSMIYVPVFYGDCMDIRVSTNSPIDVAALKKLWKGAANIIQKSEDELLSPVTHAAKGDGIFINRLRFEQERPQHIGLWVVSDPIRSGSAINGVQIAEILVKDYL